MRARPPAATSRPKDHERTESINVVMPIPYTIILAIIIPPGEQEKTKTMEIFCTCRYDRG